MKKINWVPATRLSSSNFTKTGRLKNFAKILIYLCTYISLNPGIVASKAFDMSQGIHGLTASILLRKLHCFY